MKRNETISINSIMNSIEGYFLLGMFDETKKEIRKLHAVDKDNMLGHYYKGLLWLERRDYRKALRPMLRVSALKPEMPEAYIHLAYIYRRIESLHKAIKTIKKALSIDPHLAIANYNLSCYYAQLGEVESAIDYLKRAIGRDESYVELAKTDNDFDPIKKHSRFKKLIYKK